MARAELSLSLARSAGAQAGRIVSVAFQSKSRLELMTALKYVSRVRGTPGEEVALQVTSTSLYQY